MRLSINKVIFHLVCLLVLSFFITSCDKTEDKRTMEDLIKHFKNSNLDIESAKTLAPDAFKAESAVAFTISGREIGIYKFNTVHKKIKAKVQKITNDGYVYMLGYKYPAIVNGSFIMIDYEMNKSKDKIIEVFKNFK